MSQRSTSIELDPLTSDPGTPSDGEMWYNSTDNVSRVRENGSTLEITKPALSQIKAGSATDGQLVTFNSTSGLWEPKPPEEGTGPAQERERRIFFGGLSAYPNKGKASNASEIQYTQVWILKDTEISTMETYLVQGGGSGESLRMGIYDQSTPTDLNGEPNNRVAQTNARVLTAGDDNTFVSEPLVSNYTIPATGYYWLAHIINGLTAQWALTSVNRADFMPRREEAGTGSTLPSTAGTLSNPASGIIYCAGIRV